MGCFKLKDFNDEMKLLCEQLVVKEKERQQLLEMLKTTDTMAPSKSDGPVEEVINLQDEKSLSVQIDDLDEDIPEWEKKLAKLEKN